MRNSLNTALDNWLTALHDVALTVRYPPTCAKCGGNVTNDNMDSISELYAKPINQIDWWVHKVCPPKKRRGKS